jgi:hypothetical protein
MRETVAAGAGSACVDGYKGALKRALELPVEEPVGGDPRARDPRGGEDLEGRQRMSKRWRCEVPSKEQSDGSRRYKQRRCVLTTRGCWRGEALKAATP